MPSASTMSIFCPGCAQTKKDTEFYGTRRLDKFPNGKLPQCKYCTCKKVDVMDSSTFLQILEDCDVPYIPNEWNKTILKFKDNREDLTSMKVVGRYLSKMKIKPWTKYRWSDTEIIQELEEKNLRESMERQGFSAPEIDDAIEKRKIEVPEDFFEPELPEGTVSNYTEDTIYNEDTGIADDLTEEDKKMLLIKWGKSYRPEEWVKLEQLYEEMMNSYDIQSAGHLDTLKLVCKTSLKANQLIDIGDVDGAQKMVKMYDGLMRSGAFTAAQNKAENGEAVDSVGELVMLCEKYGYIVKFYTEHPNDKADFVLQDMQRYTKNLFDGESNILNMAEMAIKSIAQEDAEAKEEEELEETSVIAELERELATQNDLSYEDYLEFEEFLNEEEQ